MTSDYSGEQQPFLPLTDTPDLLVATGLFGQTRLAMTRACADYSLRPNKRHYKVIDDSSQLVVETFGLTARVINATCPDWKERCDLMASLLVDEETDRLQFFHHVTGCDGFNETPQSPSDLSEIIFSHAIEDADEGMFLSTIIGGLGEDIEQTVEHYLDHCEEKYDATPRARGISYAKIAGKYALQAGVSAAGAAVGVAFTQFVQNRRNV